MLGGLSKEFSDFLPRLAGKLVVSWVVRRYGASGQLFGGGPVTSQLAGQSWTFGQYILAVLTAHFGSKVFGRVISGDKFREGAMDLILTKFVWTEGIARSDWAKQQFGSPQVRASPDGQAWLAQGGQWSAMQGLVEASPLDGLVEASPLDGHRRRGGYGSLMPASTPHTEADRARWSGSGYTSKFNAVYRGA